jgi:hypothetical protein
MLGMSLCLALLAACAGNSEQSQTVDAKPAAKTDRASLELPAQVKQELAPDVARRLGSDDRLAAAPVATRTSFGYSYAYKDTVPNDTLESQTTSVTYERLPERAFLVERKDYTEGDGYRKTSTTYYAVAGLLPVFETSESTHAGKSDSNQLRLASYRMGGDLFPVRVGNKFAFEAKRTGSYDMFMKYACEVEREVAAQTIDPSLSGRAFHVFCGVWLFDEPPAPQDYIYLEEFDFFLPNFFPEACKTCSDFRLRVN